MIERDEKIFLDANRLLLELRNSNHFKFTEVKHYFDFLTHTIAVVYAYNGLEYDYEEKYFLYWCPIVRTRRDEVKDFIDDIERMRNVFENYNHNNDLMWTVLAYVFENCVGDRTFSEYEKECMNDDYYIEMGRIFKKVLNIHDN